MQELNLDDQAGYIQVSANGVLKRLDVYDTINQLKDFHRQHEGLADRDYNQKLVELIEELGLPGVSHYQACLFSQRIHEAAAELAKKNAARPALPASTD